MGRDILKTTIMTNYELKQGILDKMEIEGLIQKIQRLEKQLAEKELEIKNMTREFISLQEDFYKE
jgi:predicted RNase H-like nuclease (RuvC/YqgF family)